MIVHQMYSWKYWERVRKPTAPSVTRYKCTEAEARERFGDQLIGAVEGSLEERVIGAGQHPAGWKSK